MPVPKTFDHDARAQFEILDRHQRLRIGSASPDGEMVAKETFLEVKRNRVTACIA